jgi:hypothetical protein
MTIRQSWREYAPRIPTLRPPKRSRELWRMACEYRQKAADLDSGRLPDIGVPPPKVIGQEEPLWRPV